MKYNRIKRKNGKKGILYRTKAPKLEVLSPTPNAKINVNNIQKIKKGSILISFKILKGLLRRINIDKSARMVFSIPEISIVGDPVSQR